LQTLTVDNEEKKLPKDKMDSNFSLNKSDLSSRDKRKSRTKDSSKPGWQNKKRQTTYVEPGKTFFAISDVK
jgi:hypothetical protein